MTILSAIVAIIQAIPVLQKIFEDLSALFIARSLESMKKETIETIKKAIASHDQRELEKLIGSPRAGEPSGIPGTEIRDKLPGVE